MKDGGRGGGCASSAHEHLQDHFVAEIYRICESGHLQDHVEAAIYRTVIQGWTFTGPFRGGHLQDLWRAARRGSRKMTIRTFGHIAMLSHQPSRGGHEVGLGPVWCAVDECRESFHASSREQANKTAPPSLPAKSLQNVSNHASAKAGGLKRARSVRVCMQEPSRAWKQKGKKKRESERRRWECREARALRPSRSRDASSPRLPRPTFRPGCVLLEDLFFAQCTKYGVSTRKWAGLLHTLAK